MEITRRYSMANKLKKKARGVKKCVFEVNQHSVKVRFEMKFEILTRSPFIENFFNFLSKSSNRKYAKKSWKSQIESPDQTQLTYMNWFN